MAVKFDNGKLKYADVVFKYPKKSKGQHQLHEQAIMRSIAEFPMANYKYLIL